MTVLRINIDGKAYGWQRAGNSNGVFYTKEQTRQAEAIIANETKRQIGTPLLLGDIEFVAKIFIVPPASWSAKKRGRALRGEFRPRVKPDWDNFGKLICDALNSIAWKDDAQIVDGTVRKFYAEDPGIAITITELHAV